MTRLKLVNIQFCFPRPEYIKMNKKAFLDAIIRDIRFDKKIGYAGYQKKAHLYNDISWRYGGDVAKRNKPLSVAVGGQIKRNIFKTVQKCYKKLPISTPPLFIFVFPWVGPFDQGDRTMGYVTGFTPRKNIFHIFISPDKFSPKSLQQTVAHEFNHIAFFHSHPSLHPDVKSPKSTILDVLIWEGLAENFNEEITKIMSLFSKILNATQARESLTKMKPLLSVMVDEKNNKEYENIFFGRRGYKRWTGYSVGYYIVKSFRKKYPKKTWGEIIKMKPKEIFDRSSFML